MPPPSQLDSMLQTAQRQHAGGDSSGAAATCQEIITLDPAFAPAWNLGGMLRMLARDFAGGTAQLERAVALAPDVADYHVNLAHCYDALGRKSEAQATARRAVALQPEFGAAWYALGKVLLADAMLEEAQHAYARTTALLPYEPAGWIGLGKSLGLQGHFAEAAAAFTSAVELEPYQPEHWCDLALAKERQEDLQAAVVACQRAVVIDPGYAEGWNQLGELLRKTGRAPEAVAALQKAVALRPDYAEAINHLAIALGTIGRADEALAAADAALAARPGFPEAARNRAKVLQSLDRHEAAITQLRTVLAANGNDAEAHASLANSLLGLGQAQAAVAEFRAGLAGRPERIVWSNLLFALNFLPEATAELIQSEHQRWRDAFERPLIAARAKHDNTRDPQRPLRVGYLSPDFREHAAAFFIAPMLAGHDRAQFEVFCYSDAVRTDAVSSRLRRDASVWVDVHQLSDDELGKRIRGDCIDLLVDLSVHSAENRLRVFAMKPAPVQLSYLGYCGTTGIEAIDYRITDDVVDPPGNEKWSSEKLLRLPRTFCCYAPPPQTPPVGPLPAAKCRRITFAAFNSIAKTTPAMIELWCRLLREVPGSTLLMMRPTLAEPGARQSMLEQFARHGIGADRLELSGGVSLAKFFDVFNRVDIALDTFPFNGHTTTCHGLWMGVPTVSLAGEIPVSRVGASLLRHVGLEKLATNTPDAYVAAAADLANRLGELGAIRKSLRARMQKSPLMDAAAFGKDLERTYREVWTRWCDQARDAT